MGHSIVENVSILMYIGCISYYFIFFYLGAFSHANTLKQPTEKYAKQPTGKKMYGEREREKERMKERPNEGMS